jgi:hypothetical protein
LHLGQHYYSQLTACYPILHITLDRDSLRPASPINITTLQSSTTPRHALCTPFHKPALTASVRIDLVTSTGPHRQQQRERLPPTHHTDTKGRKRAKLFLRDLPPGNTKHQTSAKSPRNKSASYSGHTPSFSRHLDYQHTNNTRCPSGILGHPITLK